MKTTLDLPDNLMNEVQVLARQEGCKLDEALIELLRKGLAASGERAMTRQVPLFKVHPQSGLPYIQCRPDAPARGKTARELVALEHEMLDHEDAERTGLSR